MTEYTLQDLAELVAETADQDVGRTKNQLRTWLANDMLPAASKSGEGVGTRRVYDSHSACVGTALVRLSQFGIGGESLKAKADILDSVFRRQGRDPAYLIVYSEDDRPRLIQSEVNDIPAAPDMQDGDAVLILDISGIKRLICE